jgi:ferredoxin-NADP reductase
MEKQIVKILKTEPVTHNVRRFKLERPKGITFIPGQAAEVSVNKPKWDEEKRPFTFTGLTDWDHLEFTIKIYPDHHGVTEQLGMLKAGDELILHDVFGAIHYAGDGVFIAGGAGVTPFIAILRQLAHEKRIGNNVLLFSNRTEADIILKDEFERILGKNFVNTLTNEKSSRYDNRTIDAEFLRPWTKNPSLYYYICGPDPMVEGLNKALLSLNVDEKKIIIEQF